MTPLHQVVDGKVTALHVVDADGAPVRRPTLHHPIDEAPAESHDCRRSAILGLAGSTAVINTPRARSSARSRRYSSSRSGSWPLSHRNKREPVTADRLLDAPGDIGEERVRRVERDIGDDPAAAGLELPGRAIGHEAQLDDRDSRPFGVSPTERDRAD